MRFLHTADTHTGFTAYNATTSAGVNQREIDSLDAFKQIDRQKFGLYIRGKINANYKKYIDRKYPWWKEYYHGPYSNLIDDVLVDDFRMDFKYHQLMSDSDERFDYCETEFME